jgi:hypothetical protein
VRNKAKATKLGTSKIFFYCLLIMRLWLIYNKKNFQKNPVKCWKLFRSIFILVVFNIIVTHSGYLGNQRKAVSGRILLYFSNKRRRRKKFSSFLLFLLRSHRGVGAKCITFSFLCCTMTFSMHLVSAMQ